MRTRYFAALALAGMALTACGGGGSTSSPLPAATTAPLTHDVATATFVVKIPPKLKSSSARTPKYLTANIQGIEFDVSQTVGTTTTDAGSVFYAIGPSQTYCTTPVGGGLTCTLAVNARPGHDTFSVTTFDQPNSVYDADVISTGWVEADISAQSSNTVNIVTSGTPTAFIMSVDDAFPKVAGTQPVHLLALDADMDIIAGPYDSPVILTNDDGTGATTLSATSVANSTDAGNLTLAWNGSVIPAWVTLRAKSTSPLVFYNSDRMQGRALLNPTYGGVNASPSYLVFANSSAAAQTITLSAASPAAAPFTADTNMDGFNNFGFIVNNTENATFIHGCAGVVTVTGTSPTFTVTPVHTGICNLDIRDSGTYYGTVPIVVQSL
jgi:hypothetical protein